MDRRARGGCCCGGGGGSGGRANRARARRRPCAAPLLALGLALGLAAPHLAPAAAQAQEGQAILVVDVARVLANSGAAQALTRAEAELRARVEAQLDAVKAELEAEERALAERRPDMIPADFARLGADFDRRVRQERRAAQERGALLLKFMEDGRAALRRRLPLALEELRQRRGAAVVIDAAAVAAWDPDIDATAAAAAIFDEMVGELDFTPPAKLTER